MEKKIITALLISSMFFTGHILSAQLTSKESDPKEAQRRKIIEGYSAEFYAGNRIENATPVNVLKWAKEALPKMEGLIPKLNKIKAANPGTKPSSDVLRLLAQVNHLKEIKAKGARLKAADAKKYDRLLFDGMAASINECLEANPGSECCFSGHNSSQGYGGMWAMANCFVARFPDL